MKKKSTIREMFSGQKGTYQQVPLSEDYKAVEKKMFDAVDTFLEKLTSEQQKLFHETYEFICEENAAYAEEHFIEGFKFGLQLGIECAEE